MKNTASASGASKTTLLGALAVMAILIMTTSATTTQAAENTGGKLGFNAQTSVVIGSTNNAIAAEFNAKTETDIGVQTVNWTRAGTQVNISTTKDSGITTYATTKIGQVTDTGNVNTGGAFNGTTNNTTHTADTGGTAANADAHHLRGLFVGTGQGVEIHCSWACRKIHP